MKLKHRSIWTGIVICLLAGLLLPPSLVSAQSVSVSIDAPDEVAPDSNFTAKVNIIGVIDFDACDYIVTFDSSVLELTGVTAGAIGETAIPIAATHEFEAGRIKVVGNVPGTPGVSGSGYLAELHFTVIGLDGTSSTIDLVDGCLSNNTAAEIATTWTGNSVHVSGTASPSLKVGELSVTPAQIKPGEEVTITVSVANTGGTEGSYPAKLKINGEQEASKNITVAAGSSQTVTFTTTRQAIGDYTVEVNGLSGTFAVAEAALPGGTAPSPSEANWPLIGGIIGGVVIIGILIVLFKRRAY